MKMMVDENSLDDTLDYYYWKVDRHVVDVADDVALTTK